MTIVDVNEVVAVIVVAEEVKLLNEDVNVKA